MTKRLAPARSVARPRGNNGLWLDHARIVDEDYTWLASVERLVLWNVEIPPGFIAGLDKLWWLDVRGGSASNLRMASGASKLRYLAVNQVRGMRDLSVVSEMLNLRYLALYGLPQVTNLPSFSSHDKLEHASIGQMSGLLSITGVLEAPRLRQLQLIKRIGVSADDVERIVSHPAIKQFCWLAEDVPAKVWMPVVEKIALPSVPNVFPEDWFELSTST